MNIAIIPARGGSRRILRKNIRKFHGRPIMAYSIEAAEQSGLFDEIWVSTEDPEIGNLAQRLGANFYERPARLADHITGTQEVVAEMLRAHWGQNLPDFACCIYATAPLMSGHDLLRGWWAVTQPGISYAYSVGVQPFRDAGQFYWGKSTAFVDRVPLDPIGVNVMKIAIDESRVCDINTEDDWQRAERMYLALREAT